MQRFSSNGELPFAGLSTPTDLSSPLRNGGESRVSRPHRCGALHAMQCMDDAMFTDAYCFRGPRRVATLGMLGKISDLYINWSQMDQKWPKVYFLN